MFLYYNQITDLDKKALFKKKDFVNTLSSPQIKEGQI